MEQPLVSIVIPFFNDFEDLQAVTDSIRASTVVEETELVVVDNSTAEAAKRNAARLSEELGGRYEDMGTNRGFAAACNRGASVAAADYVFFLNQDARLEAKTLGSLLAFMDGAPNVAAVSPAIVTQDDRVWFAGGRYVAWLGRVSIPNVGQPWVEAGTQTTEFLSGSALLIRKSAFWSVSGFDERYFLYYEDVDLSSKLRTAGWELAVLPGSRVIHWRNRHGDPLRNLSPVMLEESVRSRRLFGRTRASRSARAAARATLPIELARLGFHAARARPRETLRSWSAILAGLRSSQAP